MSLSEEMFALWAPPESRWSAWAKPVLFADVSNWSDTKEALALPEVRNFPRPPGTAVIVDVEGANSVLYGLALAANGYRPVPLYNGAIATGMLVNMRTIADYLRYGADTLRSCSLSDEAPPVFLVNSDRMEHLADSKQAGRYDNRWCVVPQDMPSAEYLQANGIRQVVLVASQVRDDIAHILRRYQDAGLTIARTVELGIAPQSLSVEKPRFYKSLWYRARVFVGLRRNAAGGFGAVIPDPSSGAGYGGYYGGFGG